MRKKTTKRSLLASVLALALCVIMLVGTTFAWFTDTASTGVNKIVSGKLDVALEMKEGGNWVSAEGKTLEFVKAKDAPTNEKILWEPGCRYELPELRISNKGNLALKYKVVISGIQGNAKLNEVIDWTMNGETLDAAALGTEMPLGVGESKEFTIMGHMQESAGNEYMALSIDGIAITVYATQDTVESDSFNNGYDEGAETPMLVSSAAELQESVAAGKSVRLTKSIVLDEELVISKDLTMYGDGQSTISGKPVKVSADANVIIQDIAFAAPTNDRDNASNLYASGLKGKLVLDGCSFSGSQWDCVQVTPVAGAEIIINNCSFEAKTNAQRFIHVQAPYASNADVKVTLTNNFFGSAVNLENSMIDLDYINLDGIDFGGNNIYTNMGLGIYVCGPSVNTTISSAEAFKKLGFMKAAEDEALGNIENDTIITGGSKATINNKTQITAGATIAGADKDSSHLEINNGKISSENVTIRDLTITGSGSSGTGGTLNINGSNTSLENVDYTGDGNIAITVSTGAKNDGTVFKKVKITRAFRGIQFWSLSGNSVIDDCVLDVAGYTFNIDAAVAGSTLTIKNSTLNGWTSYTSGIKKVSFENCKLGLNAYQYLRPYSETVLTDCEFTSVGYRLNAGGSDAYTITLNHCTMNGAVITAENVQSLLLDTDDWNSNATLIVNGAPVTLK